MNGLQGHGHIKVHHDNEWKSVPVTLTGHAPDEIDISVFSTNFLFVANDLSVDADHAGLAYSQEVFFLGFPFRRYGDLGPINSGYPMPFIKRAIVSSFDTESDRAMYLDGLNNPGFSGGPVVFQPQNNTASKWKICAVVSAYIADRSFVLENDEPTDLTFDENAGLVLTYPISHAIRLMDANPNGVSTG